MELRFSIPQILVDLGLTSVQTRVYLALVESGPSRVSAISKISKVPRPDVYRTLSRLQELGLVEEIIKKPLQYRAIPMKEGLSLLLETRTRQYEKVRAETMVLFHKATAEKPNKKIQIETPQFVLIPRGRTAIEKIKTAIERAGLGVDLVLSWKRFSQGMVTVFAESLEIAWAKNVQIRFLIECPPESKTAKQLIQFCRGKPFCQVRFAPLYPETIFGIYDKKEVFIAVKSKTDLRGSSALWSNNPNLISLAKGYFEILWLTAIEEPKTLKSKL